MAYMTKDGQGPYPNKAGEYCGNHDQNNRTYSGGAKEAYLNRMRFGRPHSCKTDTFEEMEEKGYVGLYLKEDRPSFEWGIEIPTPPESVYLLSAKELL